MGNRKIKDWKPEIWADRLAKCCYPYPMDESEAEMSDDEIIERIGVLRPHTPGQSRLYHLSGPPESYVIKAWLDDVGSSVHVRQIIAVIETDSFILDFQTAESGVLAEQCFAVGEEIPDCAVVAHIVPPVVQ